MIISRLKSLKKLLSFIQSKVLLFVFLVILQARYTDYNRRSCQQNENEDRLKVKLYDWRSMISFYCVVTYMSAAYTSVLYIGIISEKEAPLLLLGVLNDHFTRANTDLRTISPARFDDCFGWKYWQAVHIRTWMFVRYARRTARVRRCSNSG